MAGAPANMSSLERAAGVDRTGSGVSDAVADSIVASVAEGEAQPATSVTASRVGERQRKPGQGSLFAACLCMNAAKGDGTRGVA